MANTSDDVCHADFYRDLGQRASFIVYFCMTPIYLFFGLLGHFLCIRAFWMQWKTEQAYMFQIFTSVSEGCLVLAHSLYIVVYWWPRTGAGGALAPWFQSCYACIWVSAHIPIGAANAFTTTNQLFSTFLAVDRFRALLRPVTYKNPTKRMYWCCAIFCIGLGFATSAFHTFETVVTEVIGKSGYYQPTTSGYISDDAYAAFNYFRTAVRILSLLILYFCNICIPYLYRRRLLEAKNKNILPSAAEKQRKRTAKMLTMLAVTESALVTVGMTALVTFYTWLYLVQDECLAVKRLLYAATLDGVVEVTTTAHFYLMIVLSKEFRKMIRESSRSCTLCGGGAGIAVQPM